MKAKTSDFYHVYSIYSYLGHVRNTVNQKRPKSVKLVTSTND